MLTRLSCIRLDDWISWLSQNRHLQVSPRIRPIAQSSFDPASEWFDASFRQRKRRHVEKEYALILSAPAPWPDLQRSKKSSTSLNELVHFLPLSGGNRAGLHRRILPET
jgi:hypothetical protein